MKYRLLLLIFIVATPLWSYAQYDRTNALSIRNGCKLLSGPSGLNKDKKSDHVIKNLTSKAIIDEKYSTGWCSPRSYDQPLVFIFELSEKHLINELRFFNAEDPTYFGLNTKKIKVEFSNNNIDYKSIGTFVLNEHGKSRFDIAEVETRYLKFTIVENFGNAEYYELMEIEALGYYKNVVTQAINLKGHWNTNWGDIVLNENEHGLLYGCYKHNHGELIAEGVNRRTINFKWAEPNVQISGWAILVLNEEGKEMYGIWGYDDNDDILGELQFAHKNEHLRDCDNDKLLTDVYPELHNNEIRLKISLMDNQSKIPVSGNIEIIGSDGSSYFAHADLSGSVEVNVHKTTDYLLKINNREYYSINEQFGFSKYEMRYQAEIEKTFTLKKLEVGYSFNLKNVMFERGTSIFIGNSYKELNQIANLLLDHPNMKIQLSGHTDNTGSAKANLELSQERINSVKSYLIDKGVHPHQIKGIGFGGSRPIASNAHENTRKLNRRVEMKILKL